jgi:CheY-like chemotaxis protein
MEEHLQLSHKMEAVGRLAGGIAHDFNNELTVILGYTELAREILGESHPLHENLVEIHSASTRSTALIRQLLAFSRRQVLVPVVLNLNDLLAEIEKMLARLIGEDIDLLVHKAPELRQVKVDRGQMTQVLMNLVVNARDAMPEGGRLTIETANVDLDESYVLDHPHARPGEHVMISVSDSGCGMDAATRARIFEPFFTTKAPDQGTGLGLATVYGIISQSGGSIEVYSEPGHGTSFKIYIPRERAGAETVDGRSDTDNESRGTETVLLVEDASAVRALARTALEQCGYQVLAAANPQEALELLENYTGPVHFLVTDVVMPGMSGRQLVERVLPEWPGMKVLYISGYTDDAVIRHGVLDKGVPFLQKPFTPQALAQKVRAVLDQPPATQGPGHSAI